MSKTSTIMVALDFDELSQAELVARGLTDRGVIFKIGNQLGTYEGWRAAIEFARTHGAQIFCDTKFKDIPETVKLSARSIARLEPDFFNIMADTDPAALSAAVEGVRLAVQDFGVKAPKILGVTVLTSFSDEVCQSLYGADASEKVLQFASAAAEAGLDGIVCSAQEATMLRSHESTKNLLLVTPGIRPTWASSGDQNRLMTPSKALSAGADYLVIGRPITQPPPEIGSPSLALAKIMEEIDGTSR